MQLTQQPNIIVFIDIQQLIRYHTWRHGEENHLPTIKKHEMNCELILYFLARRNLLKVSAKYLSVTFRLKKNVRERKK